jgi:hypothetical protein
MGGQGTGKFSIATLGKTILKRPIKKRDKRRANQLRAYV